MIRIVLMLKNNSICREVLDWCDLHNEFEVVDVVSESDFFGLSQSEIIEKINHGFEVDLIISFLYPNKIREPLISSPKLGCINFHPAPLPMYKGVAPYVRAIMDGVDEWGVTAHFIDEEIDTGDIIKIDYFKINQNEETSESLSVKSRGLLFKLFIDILNDIKDGVTLPKTKQNGGKYFSMNDFEKLREISIEDSKEIIERKTRAFWCPPFDGAYINMNGVDVITIPKCILRKMGD